MRLTKRLALIGSLALVHLGAFSPAAIAADPPFPASQVNMIVPAAAGSGVDVLGRLIGRKLSAMWNQPVVTENVPGASGNIGHARGAKAKPDGLTILMGFAGPMSIIPNIDANQGFDPVKDLKPVILLAKLPNIMVVNPAVPAQNLREFIAYSLQNPGKVRYGYPGAGTTPHLSAEQFNLAAGTQIAGVPYSSSAQMTTDLIGGHIQMMFHNAPAILPFVRNGTVRALGITSAQRNAAAPDLPSLAEAGLLGFEVIAYAGFYVPANTPAPVVAKLNRDIAATLTDPQVKQWMNEQAGEAGGGSPEDLAAFQLLQTAKWKEVIGSRNIKVR